LLWYLLLIHAGFLLLTIALLRERPPWLFALEVIIVASAALGIALLRRSAQTLTSIRQFQELLSDRNYAARLATPSAREAAALVQQFNTMLQALYEERIRVGEQRGFLEQLLQATPSAVIVFDFDQRISVMNDSARRLLPLADYHGKTLASWSTDAAPWPAGVDSEQQQRGRHLLAQLHTVRRDHSEVIADTFGHRYRCQRSAFFDRGFSREFLLIDEISDALDQSEKTTYDKLVRVLAHEVNNTVAATGSVLQSLLFYQAQLNDGDRADFVTAIDAVRHRNRGLGEFIERFTRVVKMPEPECHRYRVLDVVQPIEQLYRDSCRDRGIALQWRRCERDVHAAFDRHLFEQALQNIVKNAIEAAEASARERGGGAYVAFELWRDGEHARLSICDSGNRLHEVPPPQLFTPFFTTKRGGQGIGLLFVREVFHRHRFTYRLAPNARGETQFDIWLAESPA
jgi:nitrogen fixation/metabolism regulation signal transduction histidine kinase